MSEDATALLNSTSLTLFEVALFGEIGRHERRSRLKSKVNIDD